MKYLLFGFACFTAGYGAAVFQFWLNKMQREIRYWRKHGWIKDKDGDFIPFPENFQN